jgi:hypothetical protein
MGELFYAQNYNSLSIQKVLPEDGAINAETYRRKCNN